MDSEVIRDVSENGKRQLSAYPYYPLASALSIGEAVKDLGGANSPVKKSVLASHFQEPEKSPGLQQRIASAKSFGIVDGRGEFTLTENGKRYFLPTSESDKSAALLSFLSGPPAFAEIIKRFDGSKLPTREILSNVFHREANVPDSWKERVASFFAGSAELARALDSSGFLRYKAAKERGLSKTSNEFNVSSVETNSIYVSGSSPNIRNDVSQSAPSESNISNVWNFSFRGKNVRLITPTELDKALWEKLNAYVQLLNPGEETQQ